MASLPWHVQQAISAHEQVHNELRRRVLALLSRAGTSCTGEDWLKDDLLIPTWWETETVGDLFDTVAAAMNRTLSGEERYKVMTYLYFIWNEYFYSTPDDVDGLVDFVTLMLDEDVDTIGFMRGVKSGNIHLQDAQHIAWATQPGNVKAAAAIVRSRWTSGRSQTKMVKMSEYAHNVKETFADYDLWWEMATGAPVAKFALEAIGGSSAPSRKLRDYFYALDDATAIEVFKVIDAVTWVRQSASATAVMKHIATLEASAASKKTELGIYLEAYTPTFQAKIAAHLSPIEGAGKKEAALKKAHAAAKSAASGPFPATAAHKKYSLQGSTVSNADKHNAAQKAAIDALGTLTKAKYSIEGGLRTIGGQAQTSKTLQKIKSLPKEAIDNYVNSAETIVTQLEAALEAVEKEIAAQSAVIEQSSKAIEAAANASMKQAVKDFGGTYLKGIYTEQGIRDLLAAGISYEEAWEHKAGNGIMSAAKIIARKEAGLSAEEMSEWRWNGVRNIEAIKELERQNFDVNDLSEWWECTSIGNPAVHIALRNAGIDAQTAQKLHGENSYLGTLTAAELIERRDAVRSNGAINSIGRVLRALKVLDRAEAGLGTRILNAHPVPSSTVNLIYKNQELFSRMLADLNDADLKAVVVLCEDSEKVSMTTFRAIFTAVTGTAAPLTNEGVTS